LQGQKKCTADLNKLQRPEQCKSIKPTNEKDK
jgi:hypothetical protein